MPSPPNESNRHHFVPRSVLRRFSPDVGQTFVYVFDKTTGSAWRGGLADAGAGKGYNVLVGSDGARLNFETDFDAIDAAYAEVGNILARRRSVDGRDDELLRNLADVAAVQFLRTPRVRTTLAQLPRDLAANLRAHGLPRLEDDLPSDDAVRELTRSMIAEREDMARLLLAKDIVLFEPAGEARFWISDHPVAVHSRLPLGEVGLGSLGVEIYLPIAQDLVVGFICPSHRAATVRHVDGGVARDLPQDEFVANGAPLRIEDAVVNLFNALQVEASERFVYGSRDDFDLARRILAQRPDLAAPRGLVRLGKAGQGPPRPANLPPGEWLYLESNHDYLLIAIREWSTGRGAREMTTDDLAQISEAASRERFEVAHIIADRRREMLRNAKVELIAGQAGRFRLGLADPSEAALDAAIEAGRSGD